VVLGIEDAVDQPAYLMSAADVELIVREISSGDIKSLVIHREAVWARECAGCFLNFLAGGPTRVVGWLPYTPFGAGVGGDNYGLVLRRTASAPYTMQEFGAVAG